MLRTTAVFTSLVQLLVLSTAEIPHVAPDQLLTWPDEANEYYFIVSKSAPGRTFVLNSLYYKLLCECSGRQLDRE